ncbi:hypothetical protein ACVCCZ_000930 [Enterobacter hormaechei]|uniref:hypothetical protein n=1 Tax=Enterobacter cloacae complex TaxID=354276 RepID=UPI000B33DA01|nr:hypothetical protein [Enterobacter hormaechei]EMA2158617.1 hypothetical protein [Enterobacter hormaechei]MCM7907774.1 hypothetical protein [Enterobacter hormaechei]MDK3136021.1 hypothetical protein [Enterobacter hormaechei]MDM9326656.1 hypothetical protein [Enterobacter hormaechei subsp. steigerwaltii]MDN3838844.1 hypothetical protein [Enterobacter hormaechei]
MKLIYDALFYVVLTMIFGIFIGFGAALIVTLVWLGLLSFGQLVYDAYKELNNKEGTV